VENHFLAAKAIGYGKTPIECRAIVIEREMGATRLTQELTISPSRDLEAVTSGVFERQFEITRLNTPTTL